MARAKVKYMCFYILFENIRCILREKSCYLVIGTYTILLIFILSTNFKCMFYCIYCIIVDSIFLINIAFFVFNFRKMNLNLCDRFRRLTYKHPPDLHVQWQNILITPNTKHRFWFKCRRVGGWLVGGLIILYTTSHSSMHIYFKFDNNLINFL